MLQLLPSLLPGINSLELALINPSSTSLPDMSRNRSILTLNIDCFCIRSDAHWRSLTPALQHLKCFTCNSAPPDTAEFRSQLRCLQSLDIGLPSFNLHLLTSLLRAAPTVKFVDRGDPTSQVQVASPACPA
ncbi:MAG: hypothetical protein WDW38_003898 [Sanguina aurantia]